MITLHIYRKRIVKPNYYANAKPISVYVDGYHICDMKPQDYTAVYVVPGTHKIVMKVPGVFEDPLTKEFTVYDSTTDVYLAFRGRMGKYIAPKIFEIAQYNLGEFSSTQGDMATVNMRCEDIALKSYIWYTVTVDDYAAGVMDGKHPEMAFNAARGKHRVMFESLFDLAYASLEVKDDSSLVIVQDCNIVSVSPLMNNSASSIRPVKCVFTRTSKFSGCAGTTRITIDNDINLSLKNGETKDVFISEGRHTLMVKANKVTVREFIVPDNCSEINILIDNLDEICSITAK